jgi:hypothetical protein
VNGAAPREARVSRASATQVRGSTEALANASQRLTSWVRCSQNASGVTAGEGAGVVGAAGAGAAAERAVSGPGEATRGGLG